MIINYLSNTIERKKITILIMHVDDIIVTGNDSEETKKIEQMMAKKFKVKDLGA